MQNYITTKSMSRLRKHLLLNKLWDWQSTTVIKWYNNDSITNTFNPIDKITELYERLLKEKDEKYAALEKRIQGLEQQNNNGK